MAVTRIKNNQITDASSGNTQLGVNAAVKLQNYSVTAGKLANNLTYGSDLTVSGNLTVNGTTTTIDTINTLIKDPILTLADGQVSGTPTVDIGLLGLRGSQNSSFIGWQESGTTFMAILSNTTASNTTVNVTSYANFTASTITAQANLSVIGNIVGAANFTGNVTAGNVLTPGLMSSTGNATHGNVLTGGLISATSTITGSSLLGSVVSASGNVTGGNVLTGGLISATSTITGGNVLTGGVVSAAGNITANPSSFFIGNGSQLTGVTASTSGFPITAGTSNIAAATNGNIGITVAGTSNVLTITSTGIVTSGTSSVSGNITGGNLNAGSGVVSTTGNVIAGNVTTGGLISATANVTGGNILTGGLISATANVTAGNVNVGSGVFSTTGNVYSGNIINTGTSSSTGNITGGNILTGGLISATSTITSAVTITGGNLATGGTASATGNVTGGNILTGGLISATSTITSAANITGGNLLTGGLISATSTITSAANITGGNILTGGLISATSNVTGGNINTAGIVSTSGNVTTPFVKSTAAMTISTGSGDLTLSPTGNVTVSSKNITSLADPVNAQDAATKAYVDNTAQGLDVKASCLVATVSNLATATSGTITYNNGTAGVGANLVTTGTYLLIDGGNVQTVGSRILVKNEANAAWNGIYTYTSTTVITRSTDFDNEGTNGQIPGAFTFIEIGTTNDNTGWVCTTNNPVVMGTTAINFSQFSGAGTYTANTSAGISLTGTVFSALVDQNTTAFDGNGNIIVKAGANLTTPNIGNATGQSLQLNTAGGNGLLSATTVSATGNVTGGNVLTGGIMSSTGNATHGNVLTGGLISATSNITGGNVLTGGLISATSNITGGNVLTGGLISATSTITSAANITGGNILTGGLISATATITGGNLATGGTASATGTITGGNILTGGVVSAVGNITANTGSFFIGNGSQLTGVAASTSGFPVTAGTSNIAAATNGNIGITVGGTSNIALFTTAGVTVVGNISANGNVTSGNILTGGLISATSNVTGGNILTIGIMSSTGNATHGNILTGGLISATANVTAGNVLTGGYVSATGNIVTSSSGSIGIGTSTPDAELNILGVPQTVSYPVTGNSTTAGTDLHISGADGANTRITQDAFGTGSYVAFTGRTGRGTAAAPTQTQTGDALAQFTARGFSNGTLQFGNVSTGRMDIVAAENFTDTSRATNVVMYTTAAGAITPTAIAAFSSANGLSVAGNVTGGNIVLTGNNINQLQTNSSININSSLANTNFAVNGATANVFFVNATTNTASFGNSTQTTNAIVAFNSTNSILLPVGTLGQRPGTGVTGMLRFNTTNNGVEIYNNSAWQSVGSTTFTVIADEQFNGDGSNVAFTLGSSQTTNSCIVSINGVVQIPTSAYSVSGTFPTCVLTFTEAPAAGDLIDVREITTTTTVTAISNNSGNAQITGDATTAAMTVLGNLVPTANVTYSLGNSTNYWSSLYVGGNTIYLGGLQLKSAAGNVFNIFASDGTTPATLGNTTISGGGNVTAGNILTGGIVSATGTITSGNLSVGTGNINVGNITNSGSTGTGNIGNATVGFNTIFAKATSAQYADLAEKYVADQTYAPGTVVSFGGEKEVTKSNKDADRAVAGVVSTNPSYIMNAGLEAEHVVTIALTGRVPTSVTGTVAKGDLMVSNGDGTARAEADPRAGAIIGKALENFAGDTGTIEVVIGRF